MAAPGERSIGTRVEVNQMAKVVRTAWEYGPTLGEIQVAVIPLQLVSFVKD